MDKGAWADEAAADGAAWRDAEGGDGGAGDARAREGSGFKGARLAAKSAGKGGGDDADEAEFVDAQEDLGGGGGGGGDYDDDDDDDGADDDSGGDGGERDAEAGRRRRRRRRRRPRAVQPLFPGDVVTRMARRRRAMGNGTSVEMFIGIVVRNGDDELDPEGDLSAEEMGEVPDGSVVVRWLNTGDLAFSAARSLRALDRLGIMGDLVTRIGSPGDIGAVVDQKIRWTLIDPLSQAVFDDVPNEWVAPTAQLHTGELAVYLGTRSMCRVVSVVNDVTVEFGSGTRRTFSGATVEDLLAEPYHALCRDDAVAFFPGQSVEVLRTSSMRPGAGQAPPAARGVVVGVKTVAVWIYLVDTAGPDPDRYDMQVKPEEVQALRHPNLVLCDVSEPVVVAPNLVQTLVENHQVRAPFRKHAIRKRNSGRVPRQAVLTPFNTFSIISRSTTVSVQWQDGRLERDLPSLSIAPATNLGDSDFFVNEFVTLGSGFAGDVESGQFEIDDPREASKADQPVGSRNKNNGSNGKLGYVTSVNNKERTCTVKWIQETIGGPYRDDLPETSLSVYDICCAFPLRSNDVVVYLGDDTDPESAESPGHRLRFGTVTSLADGWVFVHWGDGIDSRERPHCLMVMDDDDDHSYSTSAGSYMTEDEEEIVDGFDDSEGAADNSWESVSEGGAEEDEDEAEEDDVAEDEEPTAAAPLEPTQEAEQEQEQEQEQAQARIPDKPPKLSFPSFEVLEATPKDHHYASKPTDTSMMSRMGKAMRKEYRLLQRSLPETIFVRAYEDRMDLLRAVIIGPVNTPYQDTPFIFDIFLPARYPNEPPLVYYWSFGKERLNPNLYENGKVCLSLLGTWSGSDVELWDPTTSSILQVLISIQGLVLVPEPYFNEAGYEKQRGTEQGHAKALLYNENAQLLAMRDIVGILRISPSGFRELIVELFRARGDTIVARLESLLDDASQQEQSQKRQPSGFTQLFNQPPSAGFCQSLERLLPRVKEALAALETNAD